MAQTLAVDKLLDLNMQEDYTKFIRFAKVIKVYDALYLADKEAYGTVDLVWLDTGDQVNGHISYLKPGYSVIYGCGIVCVPNVNDIAACYVVQGGPPVIIGFFSRLQFEAAFIANQDGSSDIGYMRPLYAGEILLKGRSQSEIYLKKSGEVKVRVQDGENGAAMMASDVKNNDEAFYNRPDGTALNTEVEFTLGSDPEVVGNSCGSSQEVFSIDASAKFAATVKLRALPGQLAFDLPVESNCEVVEVQKVELYQLSDTGAYIPSRVLTSAFELDKVYRYLPDEVSDNGTTKNPCTVDINNSFATVKIAPHLAGEITESTIVLVYYIAKRKTLRVAGNKFGDLFMDARNIVMRANNNASYLRLGGDGKVQVGGHTVEIGDRMAGHILVDRAGVEVSPGANPFSNVAILGREDAYQSVGVKHLFYIKDDLPLFLYDFSTMSYKICERATYDSLNADNKCDILPRNFDPTGTPKGLTELDVHNMIEAFKTENGYEPPTYKELKLV